MIKLVLMLFALVILYSIVEFGAVNLLAGVVFLLFCCIAYGAATGGRRRK